MIYIFKMATQIAEHFLKASRHLQQHGYAVIPNFITSQACQEAIGEIDHLIDNFEPTPEEITVFDG